MPKIEQLMLLKSSPSSVEKSFDENSSQELSLQSLSKISGGFKLQLNNDEDLGQDIIRKGKFFHY